MRTLPTPPSSSPARSSSRKSESPSTETSSRPCRYPEVETICGPPEVEVISGPPEVEAASGPPEVEIISGPREVETVSWPFEVEAASGPCLPTHPLRMDPGTTPPPSPLPSPVPKPHSLSPLYLPAPAKSPGDTQAQEREERLRLLFLQQPDHPCSPRQYHPEDADVAGEQGGGEAGVPQRASTESGLARDEEEGEGQEARDRPLERRCSEGRDAEVVPSSETEQAVVRHSEIEQAVAPEQCGRQQAGEQLEEHSGARVGVVGRAGVRTELVPVMGAGRTVLGAVVGSVGGARPAVPAPSYCARHLPQFGNLTPPETEVLSLPDEVLIEILKRASSSTASLAFAATCAKFRDLVPECVSAVSVPMGKLVSEASLIRSLEVYEHLSSLSLGKDSVDRISDALLSFLALRRPAIDNLELAFTRDCTATGRGLGMVLRSCTTLGALSLEGWGKGCIPDLFHSLPRLRSLVLELPCNVLPESLGALSQLRSLKVSRKYGRNIKVPVSLLALTSLQELSIDCWDLSGAQECIGSLTSLTSLHLSLRFPYQLPWSLENLTKLERLSLNCRYLEVLPEGLGQLTRLESLIFVCPFLHALPENMATLQHLKTLEVSVRGCLSLPGDFWDLTSLEDLKIKCRHLLPTTPWAFHRMPQLKNLAVKCAAVANVAEDLAYHGPQTMFSDDLGHLRSSLVSLSLRSERMSRLPGNVGQLESLKRLILVAEEPEKAWELVRLRPTECLRQLPESIPLIRNLEELHIIRCRWLKELPANLGQLTELRTAIFRDCPRLEGLPASIGQLTSLEELEIEGCGAKKMKFTLPDDFQGLTKLKKVSVACMQLKSFPRSLLRLTSLESLSIGCGAHQLADAFDPSCSLQELTLVGCWRLREIPESVGSLKKLEQLMIKDCRVLRKLPESLGQLKLLKKLQVVQCPPLAFPESFGNLQKLEDLYINMRIRALPDSLAQLKALRTLHLRSLRVKAFPEVVHRLSGLHSLTLCGWPRLEGVSEDLARLVGLRKLMICCCPKLKHLPRSILEMPNLSRGCRELLALEFDLSWLQPDDADPAHNCDWLH